MHPSAILLTLLLALDPAFVASTIASLGTTIRNEYFDPKVGANFLTFAHYRIKGAIFDGLRKMGVLKGVDTRTAYWNERATAY